MRRVSTAAVAIAVTLAALLWDQPWGAVALAGLVVVQGLRELVRITGIEDRPFPAHAWVATSCLVPLGLRAAEMTLLAWASALAFFAAGLVGVVVAMRRDWASPLAACWLGAPVACVLLTHSLAVKPVGLGPNALLLVLGPLWVGDTLALVFGRVFGRHKIAPSVSPGKTWEGAVAGLVGCVATAVALGAALGAGIEVSATAGAIAGTLGLAGDLLESGLKRAAGVKDSGDVLPGHGGVLDRLDSLLLSAPATSVYLATFAPHLFRDGPWP